MSNWMPIESAPKDGTYILACMLPNIWGYRFMQVANFDFDKGVFVVSWDWSQEEFTHWMPLPQPPEGEQG